MWYFSSDCICGKRPFFHSWNPPIPSLITALSTLACTTWSIQGLHSSASWHGRGRGIIIWLVQPHYFGQRARLSLQQKAIVSQFFTGAKPHHCPARDSDGGISASWHLAWWRDHILAASLCLGQQIISYYGVSIESLLPSIHIVLHSQTAANVAWLCETNLHHCSGHSSKITKTFDHELL